MRYWIELSSQFLCEERYEHLHTILFVKVKLWKGKILFKSVIKRYMSTIDRRIYVHILKNKTRCEIVDLR